MHIACIEDNEVDFLILQKRFENHKLTRYGSHKEYHESQKKHDLVISDYQVPDLSDAYILKSINKEPIKFIIYTAGKLDLLGLSGLHSFDELGVDAMFEKGEDDDDLLALVEKIDNEIIQ